MKHLFKKRASGLRRIKNGHYLPPPPSDTLFLLSALWLYLFYKAHSGSFAIRFFFYVFVSVPFNAIRHNLWNLDSPVRDQCWNFGGGVMSQENSPSIINYWELPWTPPPVYKTHHLPAASSTQHFLPASSQLCFVMACLWQDTYLETAFPSTLEGRFLASSTSATSVPHSESRLCSPNEIGISGGGEGQLFLGYAISVLRVVDALLPIVLRILLTSS